MAAKVETGLTQRQVYTELIKSTHGDLKSYADVTLRATSEQPEFLAHLISWNFLHGQIRDSKVAIPVISLSSPFFTDTEFLDNSLAHLASLDPRNLVRAVRFAKEIKTPGRMMSIRRMVEGYLRFREDHYRRFERSLVQHRNSVKELYGLFHVKPNEHMDRILFKELYAPGSVFDAIANLRRMSPQEAAEVIGKFHIPFLVVRSVIGDKLKDADVAVAMINQMSPTEVVTNTKMLQAMGIKTNPAVRAAYEEALSRAGKSKANLLKTTRAIESEEVDETVKERLRAVQEKQIKKVGVEGNWLVLGDKSGSMTHAIELAKQVASTVAAMVKGKVYLVFFDVTPTFYDITGKSLDQVKAATKHVRAGGGTSIGCGLRYAHDAKLEVEGIAIISDGGENTPPVFAMEYKRYVDNHGVEPTVYFYQTTGDSPDGFSWSCQQNGIDLQKFDLRGKEADYYSLPNLVAGMRVSRYSLLDEIMGTPLVTLAEVLREKTVAA